MSEHPETPQRRNPWRETVRDIYDQLHWEYEECNVWSGCPLAKLIVALIEERHPETFLPDEQPKKP